MFRRKKGITLIALIITIIILLILAGVAIAALTGDNGLFSRTQLAKEKTEYESAKEKIQVEVMTAQTDNYSKNEEDILLTITKHMIGIEDVTVNKIYFSKISKIDKELQSEFNNNQNINGIVVSTNEYSKYKFLIGKSGKIDGVTTNNVDSITQEEFQTIEEFEKEKFGKKVDSEEEEKIQNYEYITSKNYGDYINYAIDLNEDGNFSNDWRIFYKSENNIYIIASNYLKIDNKNYKMSLLDASNYSGASSINSEISNKFYLNIKNSYPNLENNNMKATAYLMDQNIWSNYANAKGGEYAIGSLTLELFIKSWNEKFKDNSGYYQIISEIKSNGYLAGRYGNSVGTRPYISKSRI